MVQLAVAEKYQARDGDETMMFHVLEALTEELKWAVTQVGAAIRLRPPPEIRRLHARYSATSLGSFLTGKQLVDMNDCMVKSFGTAAFFVAQQRIGRQKLLVEPLSVVEYFS